MSITKIRPLKGYAWKITKINTDILDAKQQGVWNWVDLMLDVQSPDEVDWSSAELFKVFDDDGVWYATGKYVGPDDETLFSPLDDWARPSLGCTNMKLRNRETGKYEAL